MPRVGLRGGFGPSETLDQGECDIREENVLVHRVRCLRVVLPQERVEADAIRLFIVAGKREAEEVRRKSSKIKPRVGPATRLEAIKIEATVNAVVDAIPTDCAMDR